MAREPFDKTGIYLEIETCLECPHCKRYRTLRAGFANDYHCNHPQIRGCNDDPERPGKLIMGYVEYSRDEKPVPPWCPIRHTDCAQKILWLEEQLLIDSRDTEWAKIKQEEIDRLKEEIEAHEIYLADLRNKYGKLHTYWQLVSLEGEYKFATYTFKELKDANKNFVQLLKMPGNMGCDRACSVCTTQCPTPSFLIPRDDIEVIPDVPHPEPEPEEVEDRKLPEGWISLKKCHKVDYDEEL